MSRPMMVVVVAGFLYAATAIALVVGCALLFSGRLFDWLAQFNRPGMAAFQIMGRWAGILLLAVAAATLAAASGLLRGRKWAWWTAVALFTIESIGNIVSFFVLGDALRSGFGILICALFLCSLSPGRVRRFFNE